MTQELNRASFGSKERFESFIIQDVETAFSAPPKQQKQTIKQEIETSNEIKNTASYKEESKGSRFDFIKSNAEIKRK